MTCFLSFKKSSKPIHLSSLSLTPGVFLIVLNICSPDPLGSFVAASTTADLKTGTLVTALAIAFKGLASASLPIVKAVVPTAVEAKAGIFFFINFKASMTPGKAAEKTPYSKAWIASSAILS